MDPYFIVGLVVVAVGGGLSAYGLRRESRADAQETNRKLDEFKQDLNAAQAHPATPELAAQLDSLDQEFSAWAEDFVKNKARTQLEVEEIRTSAEQQKLAASLSQKQTALKDRQHSSNTARPVLSAAITALRKSIEAYNAKSGSHFIANLPDLPFDLFDPAAKQYKGTVQFDDKASWTVTLLVPDEPFSTMSSEPLFPVLRIRMEEGSDSHTGAFIYFPGGGMSGSRIEVDLRSEHLPPLKGISFGATLSEYKPLLQRSMQRLVEAQVYALK